MNSPFERYIRIRLYKIIITLLGTGTVICTLIYFKTSEQKMETLLAGMVTGLFVALIQYLLDWNEHREIETLKKLGIEQILPHRDEKTYYQQLLASSMKEILLIGNTGSRLMEDFAHPTRADSRVLLEALARGVVVRILLAKPEYLDADDKSRAAGTKRRVEELAKASPHFQVRYFNHAAVHSLMKVDDNCLVGPIFPHVKSKDSPTIHASAASPFVGEYLRYFENEWQEADNG